MGWEGEVYVWDVRWKGSTNRFCIRFGLHLGLPTHHPSLKFIFLGGIQGKSRGFRYSSPYSAEKNKQWSNLDTVMGLLMRGISMYRVDRSMGIRLVVWVLGGRGVLIHNYGWVACVPSIDSGSLKPLKMMTPLGSRVWLDSWGYEHG